MAGNTIELPHLARLHVVGLGRRDRHAILGRLFGPLVYHLRLEAEAVQYFDKRVWVELFGIDHSARRPNASGNEDSGSDRRYAGGV